MSYQSIKDPRRLSAYKQRRNLRQRQRRAYLARINRGAPSVAQRWNQFDPAYQIALLTYKEAGTFKLPPCSLKRARSARAKFYAFRQAIYAAVKSDTDYDPILLDLIDIFASVMLSIDSVGTDGLYVLELCRDPWVAAAASPPQSSPGSTAAAPDDD